MSLNNSGLFPLLMAALMAFTGQFLNDISSVATMLLITSLVAALRYIIGHSSSFGKTKRRYHPIASTIFNELLNFNRVHDYLADLASVYKSYRVLGLFQIELFTTDPANIEYILKTNFSNYGKGAYNHTCLSDLLGDGIFTVDGDNWRQQRKVASHEFSAKVLRDYSSAVFCSNAAKLARVISNYSKSNSVMDIQNLLTRSTMDSIFEAGFGVELDTISQSNNEGALFSKAFDDCAVAITWRFVDAFWKFKRFFNIGSEATIKRSLQVIDSFVYKLIHAKTEQDPLAPNSNIKRDDILSRFLEMGSEPKYLRDIIINFLMAGKDTTSVALSWFIYILCKHPDIQDKIAEQVREVTTTKSDTPFEEFISSIDATALEKMQYLHAAISETLRLHPPVPLDAKCCFGDDTLPDGTSVRKGDQLWYLPYAMGRMKFLWGDDAEVFRPERWLDDDGNFRHESPFKFTAFQAGPRICMGRDFAYRQMRIYSAILVGCFNFKLSDEKEEVHYKPSITLQIRGGLNVLAFHRLPKM